MMPFVDSSVESIPQLMAGHTSSREEEVRRRARREEPRRHTVAGDPVAGLARTMDLEMGGKSQRRIKNKQGPTPDLGGRDAVLDHLQRKYPRFAHKIAAAPDAVHNHQRKQSTLPRGYPAPSSTMFDDDPGIMSEAETSSTGFRRGGKQRSSLPVVRTPSKTLERPLGLVFLQYRSETKRALLPNEITSLDTVKALFVRSFPKQLTMEYLDSNIVKIYIHDSSKDMFYELEDLRDIRDRSVLRLFESDVNGSVVPLWDQDQSYFSEPEFDSEYQHQHIHKTKGSSKSGGNSSAYYMALSYPPTVAATATLPRGPLLRPFSPSPGPPDRTKPVSPATGSSQAPPKPQRSYQQPLLLKPAGVRGGPQPPVPVPPGQVPSPRPGQVAPQPRVPDRTYGPPTYMSPPERRDALYSSPDRLHAESGYISSPERGRPYPSYPATAYEDPYYSQYTSRSGSVTPVIDEESRMRVEHMERQLASLTGLVQKALTVSRPPHPVPPPSQQPPLPPQPRPEMELPPYGREFLQVPGMREAYRNADENDKHSSSSSASLPDEPYHRPPEPKHPKLGKDKSVSFEKSVSFSDEPPDLNSPKQHSPQHAADSKPAKPAIKSSTLPRVSSQERDRHKPAPPPKPVSLLPGQYDGRHLYRDLHMTPELYNQLRTLQKKAKELKQEVRNLRRLSQAQAHSVRETIRDTFMRIRAMLLAGGDHWLQGNTERLHVSREEELYKQEMLKLEKDLTELESTVEDLRSNVINRRTRVNISDVENMALILSKSSKTVADLKARFPMLQDGMKGILSSEMERVVREEKFLKEEPERLEIALKRCKKLTGTLVTLKRLASVQEQRLPSAQSSVESRLSPTSQETSTGQVISTGQSSKQQHQQLSSYPEGSVMASSSASDQPRLRAENPLDALLDELQTFAKPPPDVSLSLTVGSPGSGGAGSSVIGGGGGGAPLPGSLSVFSGSGTAGSPLRRLPSYPSTEPPSVVGSPVRQLPSMGITARIQVSGVSSSSASPSPSPVPPSKPALPEKRIPPPPPPRTSSRSPLVSPTSPMAASMLPVAPATLPRSTAYHHHHHHSHSIAPAPSPSPSPSRSPCPSPSPQLLQVGRAQSTPSSGTSSSQASLLRANSEPSDTGASSSLKRGGALRSSLREVSAPTPSPRHSVATMATMTMAHVVGGQEMATQVMSRRDLLISSNSSSSESINSQEGLQAKGAAAHQSSGSSSSSGGGNNRSRQEMLEQRHQELLRKQKQLQEQYLRLQQLQRGPSRLMSSSGAHHEALKKTGSESNLVARLGFNLSAAPTSGSLTHLAPGPAPGPIPAPRAALTLPASIFSICPPPPPTSAPPSDDPKIYETDIL